MDNTRFFNNFFDYIGEDGTREGLLDTQKRVINSWEYLYSGYKKDPVAVLKSNFKDNVCDEMVVLKNINFYSMCEHHILPFFGKISIGYIPNKRLVGVSRLVELINIFSKRLQIQERLTIQIADTILDVLHPKGVMVVAKATHLCLVMQSDNNDESTLITSAVRGLFKEDFKSRVEFLSLINNLT